MSEPKFSVGQRVAVCAIHVGIVLPVTVVVAREYAESGPARRWDGGIWIAPAGWYYQVLDASHDRDGEPTTFQERWLRPYNDDDYLDTEDEQTKEREHS